MSWVNLAGVCISVVAAVLVLVVGVGFAGPLPTALACCVYASLAGVAWLGIRMATDSQIWD